MAAIRGANTKPELIVRRVAHAVGCRFRLHRKDLPGRPDLVFPRLRKIIFVHGCFWHVHSCRYGRVTPTTNAGFWVRKRESNVVRDKRNLVDLREAGWNVLVVWECETRDVNRLTTILKQFLKVRADRTGSSSWTE
jgi:DNA mismatch endonuclease (patch repair protein)